MTWLLWNGWRPLFPPHYSCFHPLFLLSFNRNFRVVVSIGHWRSLGGIEMEVVPYCYLRVSMCLMLSSCIVLEVNSSSLMMMFLPSWSGNLDSLMQDGSINAFLLLLVKVTGMILMWLWESNEQLVLSTLFEWKEKTGTIQGCVLFREYFHDD